MTLGEHLEELRSRLIRALVALVAGAIVCFCLSDQVMGFLCHPILLILERQGYPPNLAYLNPTEPFITDLKVSLIVGFILSAPYSLTQLWGFVAAGLYPHERRWVHRFAPVSIALFFAGAAFLLVVVSPLLLNFLLSYRTELPDLGHWMPKVMAPKGRDPLDTGVPGTEMPAASQPADGAAIPVFEDDPPADWPDGVQWLNRAKWQIRVRYGGKAYAISNLTQADERPRVRPDIRIAEYVMFVLHLSAAFGIGFQVPVIVAFLAAVGIASAKDMSRYRRHVWLVMAVVAAVITPPDVTSQLFLLVPMAVLYECGLLAARFLEREAAESE